MNDRPNTAQPRILIVDDSDMDRILLRTFLERAGYREVQAVGSAREAFHLLGMPQPEPLIRAAQRALAKAQGEGPNQVKAGLSALKGH